MKAKLRDGTEIEILDSIEKIPVSECLRHINSLIGEGAWILYTKKMTMKEERAWKKNCLADEKKGLMIRTVALKDGRIAGSSEGRKQGGRNRGNVAIGIAVSKEFRGRGLGEFLLRRTIAKSKRKFLPKNIFLSVAEPNKAARKLYRKVGFREIARFPDWIEKGGKYYAQVWMVLK